MITDQKLLDFYLELSRRKRQVLQLLSQGLSNPELAARLCIQASTVAENLGHIYAELRGFEELKNLNVNRLLVISLFAPFFERHPELRSSGLASSR